MTDESTDRPGWLVPGCDTCERLFQRDSDKHDESLVRFHYDEHQGETLVRGPLSDTDLTVLPIQHRPDYIGSAIPPSWPCESTWQDGTACALSEKHVGQHQAEDGRLSWWAEGDPLTSASA